MPVLCPAAAPVREGSIMARFGDLEVPDELLDREYGLQLLGEYFERDAGGYVYSGAAFDTYPYCASAAGSEQPAAPPAETPGAVDAVTDSDVVALSLLGIRVTGYQALSITGPLAATIHDLLAQIRPQARIEDEDAGKLLARGGPAWELWELLRDITDRRTGKRLGPVAAGKLLARKRPDLVPISDSHTSRTFSRPVPALDGRWWADVRSAALDRQRAAAGMTLWDYLAALAAAGNVTDLPVLRVLDILGWMRGGGR
jgi:hypothetical protein